MIKEDYNINELININKLCKENRGTLGLVKNICNKYNIGLIKLDDGKKIFVENKHYDSISLQIYIENNNLLYGNELLKKIFNKDFDEKNELVINEIIISLKELLKIEVIEVPEKFNKCEMGLYRRYLYRILEYRECISYESVAKIFNIDKYLIEDIIEKCKLKKMCFELEGTNKFLILNELYNAINITKKAGDYMYYNCFFENKEYCDINTMMGILIPRWDRKRKIHFNKNKIKESINLNNLEYHNYQKSEEWLSNEELERLINLLKKKNKYYYLSHEIKLDINHLKREIKNISIKYIDEKVVKNIFYKNNEVENYFEKINRKYKMFIDNFNKTYKNIKSLNKWIDTDEVYNIIKNNSKNEISEKERIFFGEKLVAMNSVIVNKKVEYIDKEINQHLYNKVFYLKDDIKKFLNESITRENIIDMLSSGEKEIAKFEKRNNINYISLGSSNDMKYYPIKKFNDIKDYKSNVYIDIFKVSYNYFNKDKNYGKSFIPNLKKSICNIKEKIIRVKIFEKPYLDFKRGIIIEEAYNLEDILRFFNYYIHIEKAYIKLKEEFEELSKMKLTMLIKENNINLIIIGNQTDKFIKKTDYNIIRVYLKEKKPSYLKYIESKKYYILSQVSKLINLNEKMMNKLISENIIEIEEEYNTLKCFEKEKIDKLVKYQNEKIIILKEKYYSKSQIKEKYDSKFAQYIIGYKNNNISKLEEIKIDTLFSGFYNPSDRNLYNKEQVEKINKVYLEDKLLRIINIEDKFEEFKYKVKNILKVEFDSSQEITKKMWFEYIEGKVISSNVKDIKRINSEINSYVRNTKAIFSIFKKEIFYYKSYEINKLYLNNKSGISQASQRDFLYFLKKINKTLLSLQTQSFFNIKELNNPEDYEKKIIQDLSLYSYTEYKDLILYCNNIELHKKKALEDISNYQKTGIFPQYSFTWLYVITNLFNTLRHGTIVSQLPRIDLNYTSIKDLEWLKNNNPKIEDANLVIHQINRKIFHIGKTGVDSKIKFLIGESTKIAFSIAISLCEFIRRISINKDDTLFGEYPQLSEERKQHKQFFSEFNEGFIFKNRKMNRTVLTIIRHVTDIINNEKIGLEVSKIARSHSNSDTTKIYANLTNDEFRFLVENIFENNSFGFVYSLMEEILCEAGYINKYDSTLKIIKNNFSIEKIESTFGIINRLNLEKEEVKSYIKNMELDKIYKKYLKAKSNLLYSAKENQQCIYEECKYIDVLTRVKKKDCDNCVASITNLYALSNLMDTYIESLKNISNNFDKANDGEKKRLSNHFYLINIKVKEAREQFGKAVINNLIEGGVETIKEIVKNLDEKELREFQSVLGDRGYEKK